MDSFNEIRRPTKRQTMDPLWKGGQWKPPSFDGFHCPMNFIVTVEVAKHVLSYRFAGAFSENQEIPSFYLDRKFGNEIFWPALHQSNGTRLHMGPDGLLPWRCLVP